MGLTIYPDTTQEDYGTLIELNTQKINDDGKIMFRVSHTDYSTDVREVKEIQFLLDPQSVLNLLNYATTFPSGD